MRRGRIATRGARAARAGSRRARRRLEQTSKRRACYQELARIHFRLGDNERRHGSRGARARARRAARRAGRRLARVQHARRRRRARAASSSAAPRSSRRASRRALAHGLGSVACRAYTNLAVMLRDRSTTSAPASTAARGWRSRRRSAISCSSRGSTARWRAATARCRRLRRGREGRRGGGRARPAARAEKPPADPDHHPRADLSVPRRRRARARATIARRSSSPSGSASRSSSCPCYDGLATLAIERDDEEEADAGSRGAARCRRRAGRTVKLSRAAVSLLGATRGRHHVDSCDRSSGADVPTAVGAGPEIGLEDYRGREERHRLVHQGHGMPVLPRADAAARARYGDPGARRRGAPGRGLECRAGASPTRRSSRSRSRISATPTTASTASGASSAARTGRFST